MPRLFKRLLWVLILGALAGGVLFVSSASFSDQWRTFVIGQMAARGVYLQFTRLTVDPFRGLVAREVQVFNDERRTQLVAAVDRVSMDFDWAKLLRGEVAVESLDLADTNLALPVDPDHPELTVVNMTGVNARIFLIDDRLDIRRAEGDLSGVHLSVTGSLILAPDTADDEERRRLRAENAAKRLKFIRDNREQIQKALQWMSRFQFAQKPRVEVEINGVAEKIHEMDARVTLLARGLGYDTYVCEEIQAQAEYHAGFCDLTRLFLRDRMGTLDASGGWQTGGDEVRFRLSTSADLHGLASAFFSSDLLRELVFYEPPNLSMDGTWFVGGTRAQTARPLNVLGKLQCGRFNTRGEIFEGVAVNFGVDPTGYYLRDGLLRHKSGTLGFQAMQHDEKGLKFRSTLKMDPTVFLPFLTQEGAREAVRRFGFNDTSSVFVRVEGGAEPATPKAVKTTGHAELRGFTYKGVEFESADGDLEIAGGTQTFRNINAKRLDQTVAAEEVHVDSTDRWVRLKGVTGKLDPVVMLGIFAPKVADYISRYKLSDATQVAVSGTVGWRGDAWNDLKAFFHDPAGAAVYPLWGKEYKIGGPAGEVTYVKNGLTYDVKGLLFTSPMSVKGKVNLAPGVTDYTVSLKAVRFPFAVIGKDLPFGDLNAGIAASKGTLAFDVTSKVFGGNMKLAGTMENGKDAGGRYQGELRVDAASFRQFAQTYSPKFETEGDLTGYFKFTGALNDWQKLKGNGVAIIVNGNLYAIPIIGPLTSLLTAVIPSPIKGYNVAKEANCTFNVADGFIVTDNFEALTSAFRIVTNGNVDFIKDSIDFDAQVRVRGLPGIVLRPVSELLEYKGEGTVGKPQWRLNPFGIAGGKKVGIREDGRRVPEPAPKEETKPEGSSESGGSLPSRLKRILPFGLGK